MKFPLLSLSFLSGILLFLFSTGAAFGGELTLENGDRLTGTIVKLSDGTVVVKTTYGGTIQVAWAEVSGIASSGLLFFTMADGSDVEGVALPADEGKVGIRSSEIGEITFHNLAAIKGIRQPGTDENTYLRGRLSAAAYVADGNSDTRTYHFASEIVGRAEKNRLTVGASYDAASDQGSTTEENMEGYLKYDYFIRDKWYLYANAEAAKDRFKDLNLRTFVGFGLGHQVWDSERRSLSFEAGLGYSDVDYELAPDDHYPSARWAADYGQKLYDTEARFFHKHELLIGLEESEDLYLQAKTGVSLPLYKSLNATAQVDFEWNNTPAAGTQRSDTLYRLGIEYTW